MVHSRKTKSAWPQTPELPGTIDACADIGAYGTRLIVCDANNARIAIDPDWPEQLGLLIATAHAFARQPGCPTEIYNLLVGLRAAYAIGRFLETAGS